MPLRFLPNAAETLYSWLDNKKDLYRNKLVTIPTPKFYMLYNGKAKPISDVLRLSDSFRFDDHKFSLELTVKIINVNYEVSSDILTKSHSLNGYAYLVSQIRKHTDSGMERDKAIANAVNHCIEKDILADFLAKNYKEVCGMFDWGITIEEEMEIREEEAREEGIEKGKKEGKKEGFSGAAMMLLKNGMNIQDVARMLELSDSQFRELQERAS